MTEPWNPSLYLAFAGERTRPALDLAARVEVTSPARIIDLGCGPGNSTAVVRARWPAAAVTGMDSDPAMLAAAAKSDPATTWVRGDATAWGGPAEAWDVVFSNAMLQWVPDHAAVFPRLFASVNVGGALAVQIPTHLHSALHRHMVALAELPRWRDRTRGARTALMMHEPTFYYDLLCRLAAKLDIWETEYQHVLAGPEAVVEWIRATGLRPFVQALASDDDRRDFEAMLLERVTASYPRRADGKVILGFRRLFVIAYRA